MKNVYLKNFTGNKKRQKCHKSRELRDHTGEFSSLTLVHIHGSNVTNAFPSALCFSACPHTFNRHKRSEQLAVARS
jgi:hypothetical protein